MKKTNLVFFSHFIIPIIFITLSCNQESIYEYGHPNVQKGGNGSQNGSFLVGKSGNEWVYEVTKDTAGTITQLANDTIRFLKDTIMMGGKYKIFYSSRYTPLTGKLVFGQYESSEEFVYIVTEKSPCMLFNSDFINDTLKKRYEAIPLNNNEWKYYYHSPFKTIETPVGKYKAILAEAQFEVYNTAAYYTYRRQWAFYFSKGIGIIQLHKWHTSKDTHASPIHKVHYTWRLKSVNF